MGAAQGGLDDKTYETPEPVAGNNMFLNDRVKKVKTQVEEETGKQYAKFTATEFLKRNFHYTIKVDISDGKCLHLMMRKEMLLDFEEHNIKDPMRLHL